MRLCPAHVEFADTDTLCIAQRCLLFTPEDVFIGTWIFLMTESLKCPFFMFIVCAEAYNPDEEEDDAESRVCHLPRAWILNGNS